jgi:hypothetical protein
MHKKSTLTFLIAALTFCLLAPRSLYAESYPPGLSFASLLNGVKIYPKTGEFYLDFINATFLPSVQNSAGYPYDPDSGGKVWAILSDSSGAEVARFDFWAEPLESPYWLLNSYRVTIGGNTTVMGTVKLDKGKYSLDFFLEGVEFYKYPFAVDVLSSPDPFSGGTYYFLEGDWNKMIYLFYAEGDPKYSLMVKAWLRNKEIKDEKDVSVDIKITRDGGDLVCNSRPEIEWTLNPSWVRCEFEMVFPHETYGEYFKANNILAKDGAYTLTMKVGGELYGTWHFSVKNGAFTHEGRADRATADPLTFIEGGREAWWYEKS